MENTSSSELNSKVSEITTLLDTLEEIMGSYTSASNAEKKNIEQQFNTTKQKAIDLQTEINNLLNEMKLEQPVMDVLKEKYPKYVNSLEDLHVLNTKTNSVSHNKNNKKNNAPAANNNSSKNTAAANNNSSKNTNETATVGGRRKSRRLSKKRSKRTRRGVRR